MARKTAVPSEQLDRLKDLYNQQRGALVALAAADDAVAAAEQTLAAGQQGVKDAHAGVETAYQALVELMGPAAAAGLTGRRANGKRPAAGSKPDLTHKPPQTDRGLPALDGAPSR